jgi:hypothetical protein
MTITVAEASFGAMVERLARSTKFVTIGGKLGAGIERECKRKRKRYPSYVASLVHLWRKHAVEKSRTVAVVKGKTRLPVAPFVHAHHARLVGDLLTGVIKLDPGRLAFRDPDSRSRSDFNAKLTYTYTKAEVASVDQAKARHGIEGVSTEIILNQVLLSGLYIFGAIIEKITRFPFLVELEIPTQREVPEGRAVEIFFSCRDN